MIRKPLFFYGWVIVGITVISMTIIYGVRHSFSIFFADICREFKWNRGSTAFMFSLNILAYGMLAPVAGSLADRCNPKKLMSLGCLIIAFATAACSLAEKLWHFYLLFGILIPIGTVLTGWPTLAPAISSWFIKSRGMAFGIAVMGGGLSFTTGIWTDLLISRLGWRVAYVILGAMVVGVVLPIIGFFFHHRPECKRLLPYGFSKEVVSVPSDEELSNPPPRSADQKSMLALAVRSHRLWLLVLAYMLYWGLGIYLVMAHQVIYAEDLGYGSLHAASVFAMFGVFLTIGQFLGFLADRWGRETAFTLSCLLAIAGIIILLTVKNSSQVWVLHLFAMCFGLGGGLMLPTITAGAADLFDGPHFGAINGLLLMGMGIGGAIGPWLGGSVFDITGNYTYAFLVAITALVLAWLAFWVAAPRKPGKTK